MVDKKQEQGYFPTLLAAAPVFALKSVIGDLPKASLEHVVEAKTLGGNKSFWHYANEGIRGKGTGRMLGGALGIATAPLFLKGTRLLQSKDPKERKKGYGYVAAATAGLAGAKGLAEGALQAHMTGASPLEAASKGAFLATVRSAYKVPVALATAAGIAAGRRTSNKDGSTNKYLLPVAMGAGAGALSRVIEEAADMAHNSKLRGKIMSGRGARRLGASGLGGAAGGMLGGLVLAKVVDALAPKEKKSSVDLEKVALVPEVLEALMHAARPDNVMLAGNSLAEITGHAAKNIPMFTLTHGLPGAVPQHILTGAGMGYHLQGGAVQKLLGNRVVANLIKTQNNMRARQFGIGIQEGLVGQSHQGMGASFLSNFGYGIPQTGGLSPESVLPRQMGIDLGRHLRKIPEEQRVNYLRKIQKVLLDNPKALLGPGGEVNPLTGHVLGGIEMAIGARPFREKSKNFPTFQKAWINTINKGRGYSEHGLPTQLGKLRAKPGYLAENAGNLATAAVALPLATMSMGTLPVLPHIVGALGGHGIFSSVKGGITTSAPFKNWVHSTTHGGYRTGLFPNARRSSNERLGDYLGEIFGSPVTTGASRGIRNVSEAARDQAITTATAKLRELHGIAKDKYQAHKHNLYPKEVLTPLAVGAGAGLGINYAFRHGVLKGKEQ